MFITFYCYCQLLLCPQIFEVILKCTACSRLILHTGHTMIEVVINNNIPCIYKIEDWEVLRKEHRIVGTVLGTNFPQIPSLPVQLLPEEALLLKKNNVVKFVINSNINKEPDEKDKQLQENLQHDLFEAEKVVYREVRKDQTKEIFDKILSGKRKHGDDRPEEEIFEEVLEKKCAGLSETSMISPILLQPTNAKYVEIEENTLLNRTTPLKVAVFEDLWKKGYYVTTGNKFGGDFLTYLGDPVLHHAVNIVQCIHDMKKPLHPSELIAFGRVATSVRRKALLASLEDDKIVYITLSWMK